MSEKTEDRRETRVKALSLAVHQMVSQDGWRVESQSEYMATLRKGRKISHLLHLVLTLLTGIWAIVWVISAVKNKQRVAVVTVDDYGNIAVDEN